MSAENARNAGGRTALLVLGMHRSGTSALTGTLAHLGFSAPRTQITPGGENPRGFFESRPVARFNDRILAAAGMSWHDWRPLDLQALEGAGFQDAAAALLAEEFGEADHIVLKDPRICRLVPIWSDVLERCGYRTVPVLIHRDPLEVAQSLQARNGCSLTFGLLLWLRYVLDAERLTRGRPRTFTSYACLLADWRAVIRGLGDRLGVAFPTSGEAAGPAVDGFLSTELRRSAAVSAGDAVHPRLMELVHRSSVILERWSADREESYDHASLDLIAAELVAASWVFVDTVEVTNKKVEKLEAVLRAERAQVKEERDRHAREFSALARRLQEAERQFETSRRARLKAEQRLQAIIGSSSWRFTAPMRRIADRLRGI